ncbi:SRPBCC family protein [Gordonia sp. NPDC003424]
MGSITRRGIGAAAAVGLIGATYAGVVRPHMLRWGALEEEVDEDFPDAGIVPDGTRSATMATSIDAPPAAVWPWLAQMGTDRGGWYSWDRLDNWGRHSATRIHPEWQDVTLGDRFLGTPDGSQAWEVVACEPQRFLALRMTLDGKGRQYDPADGRPSSYTDSTWSFWLRPLPDDRTRLVVSGYWAFEPRWLKPIISTLMLEPSHWVMQTRQFHNLKRRVADSRVVNSR